MIIIIIHEQREHSCAGFARFGTVDRGDKSPESALGWAGGSAGPDFFIYTAHMSNCAVGGCPATHWAHDHTVFAEVADDATWKAIEALYALPVTRGGMTFFKDKLPMQVGWKS